MDSGVPSDLNSPKNPEESLANCSGLPPNIEIIDWIDAGPAFRYSDLNPKQKRELPSVLEQVGEATGTHWSRVRFHGVVDEPVDLVDQEHPDRESPSLHPSFVQRPASKEVIGDTVIVPPGLAYPESWHQGNWISVSNDLLVDCADLESP